jgi:hypothetical protein
LRANRLCLAVRKPYGFITDRVRNNPRACPILKPHFLALGASFVQYLEKSLSSKEELKKLIQDRGVSSTDMEVVLSSSDHNHGPSKTEQPRRVIPARTYQPYATTYLETPLWSLILEPLCLTCLQPVLRALYQLRALLAPPMRVTLVPRILAGILPSSVAYATVGDFILLTPLVVFFLRGIHYTFVAPSLNLSGTMAAYCLYCTYVTAAKSNSPFSFFLGIPYERLIGLHAASAVAAVLLGGFHGYVAFHYGGDDDGDSPYSEAAALSDETLEPNLWKFLLDGTSNLTGTILLASMTALVLMSTVSILRRYAFNLWYCAHLLLGLAVW